MRLHINWRQIRVPRMAKRILLLVGVVIVFRLLLPNAQQTKSKPVHRVEQVRVVDWSAVDKSVREVFMRSGAKAEEAARASVHEWVGELSVASIY